MKQCHTNQAKIIPELASLFQRHRLKQKEGELIFEFSNIRMFDTLEAVQVDLALIGYEYKTGEFLFVNKSPKYPSLKFHTEPEVQLEIK